MSGNTKDNSEGVSNAKWGDEAHQALAAGLAVALDGTESSVAKSKDTIIASMAKMGFTFTWEAIR
ncbi:hypothetical protein QBC44DRAFT_364870 [Cladorrhinum sp. PSN332]|nr:hypothetical protein QBC44DRAFT_364870 [Cladorrhinum sp. PSN332]